MTQPLLNRHDEFIPSRHGHLICERCGNECDVLHSVPVPDGVPRELVCAVCKESQEREAARGSMP
jgi:hypothetical protein